MTTTSRQKKSVAHLSIHEEIIARASESMQSLPMLDVIYGRMATGLTSAFKSKAAVLVESSVAPVEYMTWSDAISNLEPYAVCGVAEADPWAGSVIIAMDSEFFYPTIETQMRGTPIPGSAPKRAPSSIEQRLGKRITGMIADEMADSFSRLTEVSFKLDSIETPQQVNSLQGTNSPCAVVRFNMKVGGCEGGMTIIFPMQTLEPAQIILSKMFLGEKLGGDGTWREFLMEHITGSSVNVYARFHEVQVSLGDVMAWEPGTTIDLGIFEGHEATVMCSGIPIFHAAVGKKRNDRVALRVTRENGDSIDMMRGAADD
jgi:flagellar motor switch protein FliM